jgi:diketogulonate reductase-like aldo/keto reductase
MYGTAWKKDATAQLVILAVECGFTAIDTANQLIHYQEALVGEALQSLAQQGVKRESLFLQSKFTSADGQDHRTPYDPSADLTTQVQQSFDSSLEHLHTDYLDSYVLHAPFSRRGLGAADWEVWAVMESLIGGDQNDRVNITAAQLALLPGAQVKPMIMQNRCFRAQAWISR